MGLAVEVHDLDEVGEVGVGELRFRGRACSREEDPVGWVSGFRGRAMEELVVTEEGKVVK